MREREGDRDQEGDDTRFVAHAQHEFAHGSRSKRESSTWFARAGGGRDETQERVRERTMRRQSEKRSVT